MTTFNIGDAVRIPNERNCDIEFVGGEQVTVSTQLTFQVLDTWESDQPGVFVLALSYCDQGFTVYSDTVIHDN